MILEFDIFYIYLLFMWAQKTISAGLSRQCFLFLKQLKRPSRQLSEFLRLPTSSMDYLKSYQLPNPYRFPIRDLSLFHLRKCKIISKCVVILKCLKLMVLPCRTQKLRGLKLYSERQKKNSKGPISCISVNILWHTSLQHTKLFNTDFINFLRAINKIYKI